jgi:hypothetical protein
MTLTSSIATLTVTASRILFVARPDVNGIYQSIQTTPEQDEVWYLTNSECLAACAVWNKIAAS